MIRREMASPHFKTVGQDYQLSVSDAADDHEWDAFLAQTRGGHHVQTSLWGQVKRSVGWHTVRVIARRDGTIVGGGQLQIRPFFMAGAIGYVPKGPLLVDFDERLAGAILDALHREAVRHHVRFLLVQPPSGHDTLARYLERNDFQPSLVRAVPVATTVVDLMPEPEEILAGMKSKTRYNIRLAERKGIVVRLGDASDLPVFHGLLLATARRQGFGDYGLGYFEELRRCFTPGGHFQLFIAEFEGRPLSALLLIPFGETALFKKGGWSGEHGRLHPNERMHWEALKWSREAGYRYYDFEGIDEAVARQIVAGVSPPSNVLNSVTRFKLGFGGEVRVNPGTYDYVYNPLFRWAYRRVFPLVARQPWAGPFIHRLIGR